MLHDMLKHTPLWVYGLLAGLVALGLQQSRNREIKKVPAFIVPVVMVIMSFSGVYSSFGWQVVTLGIWLAGLLGVGLIIADYFPGDDVRYHAGDERFSVKGSWAPLCVILIIFFAKYTVGVMAGMQNPLLLHSGFIYGVSFLYGGLSGFFVARAWRLLAAVTQSTQGVVD